MKKKTVLFTVILFGFFILLSLPCHGKLVCEGPATTYLEYPGLWFLILIPLSIFALVLSNQKHMFWLKFTGVFFVVSMLIVFAMPEYGSGIVSFDRELTNWFFAGLYAFISLIYFIVQFIKSRRTS